MVNIERMLKVALFGGILSCPYCESGSLEPDYEVCPECNKPNPLRKGGERRAKRKIRQKFTIPYFIMQDFP